MGSNHKLNKELNFYFETYDAGDLIAKLGALNLEFENQNKNLITSYGSIFGLCHMNSGKPYASNKTFKKLISTLNNGAILPSIQDPAEACFFEKAFLDKEYVLFNGINTFSTFYVNSIINILFYRKTDLPPEFINKAIKLIKCALKLSDNIYQKINLDWNDIADHRYEERLLMSNGLDFFKNLLFIEGQFLESLISISEINEYFVCNERINEGFENLIKDENPFYYFAPLLKMSDGRYLLIDPTAIGFFIKSLCVRLSEEFKCKELFGRECNWTVFDICKEKCKMLSGVAPINEEEIKELHIEGDDYSQVSYAISKEKVLFILCAFDFSLNSEPKMADYDNEIDKAFVILISKGYKMENIYSFLLVSSFGGTFSLTSGYNFANKPLIIGCSELDAIQINEKDNPFFLISFTKFSNYYFSHDSMSMIFSTANLIALLNEKKYDFYIDDEIRIKGTFLNLGFDFIYPYQHRALKQEQESVAVLDSVAQPLKLIKYEDNIYFPNPLTCVVSNAKLLYLKLNNGGIWFASKPKDENSFLVSRAIAYWISQIKVSAEKYIKSNFYIQIENHTTQTRIIPINETRCSLLFSNQFLQSCGNENNQNEIALVVSVLKYFHLFNNEMAAALLVSSKQENKKIIYILNTGNTPFFEPLKVKILPVRGCKMYQSEFDDMVGDYLVDDIKMPIGLIENPSESMQKIVEYLYREFQSFIGAFDWRSALKICYLHCESIIQELFLSQDNMKHQIALFPEHEDSINENYNSINTASVSIRFVIEYLAAVHPEGVKEMDDADVQFAISMVANIIKWANLGDYVKYGLIDELKILKSYRIGYDHKNIIKFNEVVSQTAFFDISHKLKFIFKENDEWPFKKELDDAYIYEHEFTTKQLMITITVFSACGSEQTSDIKTASRNDLLSVLNRDGGTLIDEPIFWKVVDYISLNYRHVFYCANIKPRELHPWKYNREYSLLRKPVIKYDDIYLWGNRMISHSYLFIMQTIFNGKEPSTRKGKNSINTLNGKILERIGDDFNNKCFEFLSTTNPNVAFYKCVKSMNNKKIENSNGETLGDIDILGIDRQKKSIYLIETKDFFYSRNPAELNIEMKEMFLGDKRRKSFVEKERNRVEWVKNHIDDVVKEYNLVTNEWKIKYTFLSDKPLLSCEFSDKKINHTCLKMINLEYLRKLNSEV